MLIPTSLLVLLVQMPYLYYYVPVQHTALVLVRTTVPVQLYSGDVPVLYHDMLVLPVLDLVVQM